MMPKIKFRNYQNGCGRGLQKSIMLGADTIRVTIFYPGEGALAAPDIILVGVPFGGDTQPPGT